MFYTPYSKINDFFARKGLLSPLGTVSPCPRLKASLPPVSGNFDQCGVVQYGYLLAPPFEVEFTPSRVAKIIFPPVP